MRDSAQHDFLKLTALFTSMLIPENMPQDFMWTDRASIWRLILAQQPDGRWDLSQARERTRLDLSRSRDLCASSPACCAFIACARSDVEYRISWFP